MTSDLYTGSGDDGSTGLADGSRVTKDSARIDTIGSVDELNALLGLVASQEAAAGEREMLYQIQHRLFDLGAELAAPGTARLDAGDTGHLEGEIDRLDALVPPLRHFILPGGTGTSAMAHLARTVCRRAERQLFLLSRTEAVNAHSLVFLNRLSDLLFALARVLVHQASGTEIAWRPK
ncbi:MAG: cob(I)yrinic acid a,c-diamide adenosyltransferase [Pseudomonadota bacterium]